MGKIKILSFFIFSFLSTHLLSQNIYFSARADAKQVPLEGYVEVSFTLQNANLDKPQLPDFRNFNVMSGPNKGSSITVINGVKTEEKTISFTLQAKTLGVFTLAPARVIVNGKTYSTASLQIEVVKSSNVAKGNQKTAFLALETAQKETYIGGQIVLNLKLYSTITLSPQELLTAPNLDNFFQMEIEDLKEQPIKEVIKGVQYQTKILKRILLFPQKEGIFTISPYTISALAGDTFDANMISLQSNELIINAKKLPDNPPLFFNGAIGVLELESTISKNEATTDDALTMQVTITGKGNPNNIFAPKFKISDSLELYEPKMISESDANQSAENLTFSKTFEYIIVPKYAGNFELKPTLVYFDTETIQYETISTSAHRIDITQGKGMLPISPNTNNLEGKNSSFGDWAFAPKAGIALSLLALIALFLWLRKKNRKEVLANTKIIKTTKFIDNQIITNTINDVYYIDLATKDAENSNWNSFYKNIEKAIINNISTYLNLSESAFSRLTLLQKLEQSPRATEAVEAKELLAICDKMRFGSGEKDLLASEVLRRAKVFCNK